MDFCELSKVTAICLMGGRRKPVHSPPPASPGSSMSSFGLQVSTFCDKGSLENDPASLTDGETEVQGERVDPSTELGRPRAHEAGTCRGYSIV